MYRGIEIKMTEDTQDKKFLYDGKETNGLKSISQKLAYGKFFQSYDE